jgi:hypothetical protein
MPHTSPCLYQGNHFAVGSLNRVYAGNELPESGVRPLACHFGAHLNKIVKINEAVPETFCSVVLQWQHIAQYWPSSSG